MVRVLVRFYVVYNNGYGQQQGKQEVVNSGYATAVSRYAIESTSHVLKRIVSFHKTQKVVNFEALLPSPKIGAKEQRDELLNKL